MPCGVPCVKCGKTAKPGQFVVWHSVPQMHIIWHKACIEEILEEIPEDLDKTVEVEYNEIRNSYIEGNVFA